MIIITDKLRSGFLPVLAGGVDGRGLWVSLRLGGRKPLRRCLAEARRVQRKIVDGKKG